MAYNTRQMVCIMRTIAKRYTREQTAAMTRAEFNALIASVGAELYA